MGDARVPRMFVSVNSALLGLRFQERSHMRLRSQMTLPKINRSLALRALLVTGVLSAIGGVTLAGAASSGPGVERAPRSVALVKAHQYTARPRPKHDATGERGLPGERGPRGQAGPAGSSGPSGPAGPQGVPGRAGLLGPIGPKGRDGEDGEDGAKGDPGARGADGSVGDTGQARRSGRGGTDWPERVDGTSGRGWIARTTGRCRCARCSWSTGCGVQGAMQGLIGCKACRA